MGALSTLKYIYHNIFLEICCDMNFRYLLVISNRICTVNLGIDIEHIFKLGIIIIEFLKDTNFFKFSSRPNTLPQPSLIF